MAPPSFHSNVSVTHIGTATALLSIDGVHFLTDPVFDANGTSYDFGGVILKSTQPTELRLQDLPPFENVLLSHEDHPDNLDTSGRLLLDGRHVLTTHDGAANLAPRPGVQGLAPWQSTQLTVGGKTFTITATLCKHLEGGEVVGFVVHTESFGVSEDSRPNVIYLSGDTVYLADVAQRLRTEFNVVLAMLNLGAATVSGPEAMVITLDAKSAIQFATEMDADILVPLHYDSWLHFAEPEQTMRQVLTGNANPIKDRVRILEMGKATRIL